MHMSSEEHVNGRINETIRTLGGNQDASADFRILFFCIVAYKSCLVDTDS